MPLVVGVHGVGQQLKAAEVLVAEWGPPLRGGVSNAGGSLAEDALACAFYGGLFRPPGRTRAAGDPHYRPSEVTPDEAELLQVVWEGAATLEPDRVTAPDAQVRASAPKSVQAALRALSRSRFFAGLAEHALIGDLKQVARYLHDPAIRDGAQSAVDAAVGPDTRVLIGHSLGSVVAFEALHRYADSDRWSSLETFVTLGSPLGIRNLVFEKLEPAPIDGIGVWPPRIRRWINISADGDIVALTKTLGLLFGDRVEDIGVDNQARAHDIMPYLTAPETGETISHALG